MASKLGLTTCTKLLRLGQQASQLLAQQRVFVCQTLSFGMEYGRVAHRGRALILRQ